MQVQTQEARIIMAMEALQTSKRKLSRRRAASIYKVPESTFRDCDDSNRHYTLGL